MQINEGKLVTETPFLHMPSPMITAKVTVESEFDVDKMADAIERLVQAHPLLQCKVARKADGTMWFEREMKYYTWGYEQDMDWVSVLARCLDVPLDLSLMDPLRISVIDQGACFDLIMICHHAICDGNALTVLMKDLLTLYCTGGGIERRDSFRISGRSDFPEQYRFSDELRCRLEQLNSAWREKHSGFILDSDMYASLCRSHTQSVGFDVLVLQLDKDEMAKLKESCREAGVTINSAISTAILYALAPDGRKQKATIAVDVRGRMGTSLGGVSDYSSCIAPLVQYDAEISFMENVKRNHEIFQEELTDTNKLLYTLQLFSILDGRMFDATYAARYGYFTDFEFLKHFRDVLSFGSDEDGFDVSNLGNVDIPGEIGDLRIRDLVFVPNLTMVCDYTFGVATLDGVMNISICYKSKRKSRQDAERVSDALRQCLI